ncbi:MAG: AsmA-like C-terminal region-containing protein [Hyphomicrobiaceae bacterium]
MTGRPTTGKPVMAEPAPQAARWRWLSLPLRAVAWLLAIIVPLGLLGGGLVYVKLLYGAIPLQFLVGPIREALAGELDGLDVAVGDAQLTRTPEGEVELRLKDVRLSDSRGDTAVSAPEAIVGLDASALWSGQVAASRIVLVGPRLLIVREEAATAPRPPGALAAAAAESGSAAPVGSMGAAGAARRGAEGGPVGREAPQRIDLGRGLAETIARLRRSGEAASHLKALGVRNATLEVESDGRTTVWNVPELSVQLLHLQKRSIVEGHGRIAAGGVPFGIEFRLEESEKAQRLRLETRLQGLSPPALARNLPHLGILAALDAPATARGEIELTTEGEVVGGRFDVALGQGSLRPGALAGPALPLDGGRLTLLYSGNDRRLEIAPSRIMLDGGWVTVRGELAPLASVEPLRTPGWLLDLQSIDGGIATAAGQPPVPIDRLEVRARLWPATGRSDVETLAFRAGEMSLDARGTVAGGESGAASFSGEIGPIEAAAIKRLWPAGVLPGSRDAVAKALQKGRIKAGRFEVATASAGAAAGQTHTALSLEAEDLAIVLADGVPPLLVPRALVTQRDNVLEIAVPDATIQASPTRRIAIKACQLVVTGLDRGVPLAELTGRAQTSIAAIADIAARDGVSLVKPGQVPQGTDGKVEVQWKVSVPLVERPTAADVKLEAKARITEGRIPNVLGTHDVTGAAFTIGATEKMIDLKGEVLLAGLRATATGQWMLGEPQDRQSPFLIATRLRDADRRQLGLNIDDLVQGDVPIEVQFTPSIDEHGKVQVSADLTGAELMLDGLAWRKPSGRVARMTFDVVRPKGSKALELQSFRIAGDSITIDGSVALGADGAPQSYRFPGFSLNVVSNLEVEGIRRGDRHWEVKARGRTFDGSDLMRSLYAVETTRQRHSTGRLDLDAHIETVLGVNDTTVKQVHLKMRRQGDDITALDLTGTMDTGQPVLAHLRNAPGEGRVVVVTTPDAGQALKSIGFYTSMLGGKGELRVNLDGRGGAERAGQIVVNRFRILGDPIVNELIEGADDTRPAIAGPRAKAKVVRQEIAFDMLRGSFASGNGQVAIESLTAAGPLIGANVRGKMDFRTRSLSLGGTYIPLSGLNRALSGIPLFGQLLTGPRGDGIFGITFAVDGSMAKPNVIVNPLSIVAPGVFREIFQMVPENPRVTPTEGARPAPRNHGAPAGSGRPASAPSPQVLEGWTSQQSPSRGQ